MPSDAQLKEISNAIRTGNSKELSKHFNSMVELTLPSIEGSYSKMQAEMILKAFFEQNPPKTFSVEYVAVSTRTVKTVIGQYENANAKYSIYFLLKSVDGQPRIQKLQFEVE